MLPATFITYSHDTNEFNVHKMKKLLPLFVVLLISTDIYSQTYIQNVTVIDVVNQKLVAGQTVTIRDNKIVDIKPSKKVKISSNAATIDGSAKYLLPGMTDAHVHFFQSGGLYTRPDAIDLRKYHPYEKEIAWTHDNMEDLLRHYVQNGITSVIDVGATYNLLQQRDTFQNKSYAPHIFMTGPLLTSYEPAVFKNLLKDEPFNLVLTPEDGIKGVDEQLPYHPDFIKIWYIVNERSKDSLNASAKRFQPVVKAIIDEAHKHNLKVAVPATQRLAAQLAVESGCDYLVHDIDNELIDDNFIKLLKTKSVIVCPTLIVEDGYIKTFSQTQNYSFYNLTKSNPQQIGSIEDLKHLPDTAKINYLKKGYNSPDIVSYLKYQDSVRMVNLKKMIDGGVTIAAGTDAGNIGTQHATSFFDELLAMKQSGLSNWQIIQSATINPARILNKQEDLGSIAVGKQADLVLLNANPVDDIENITKISLVINKGIVINPDTLVKITPEDLVQQQLNAYNAGNIDAFLEPYADSIEIYNFPDKLIGKGKEIMQHQYSKMFNDLPNLHCEIKKRIINGNTVIDHESISGIGQPKSLEAIAIYKIENNKIVKVYFIE